MAIILRWLNFREWNTYKSAYTDGLSITPTERKSSPILDRFHCEEIARESSVQAEHTTGPGLILTPHSLSSRINAEAAHGISVSTWSVSWAAWASEETHRFFCCPLRQHHCSLGAARTVLFNLGICHFQKRFEKRIWVAVGSVYNYLSCLYNNSVVNLVNYLISEGPYWT